MSEDTVSIRPATAADRAGVVTLAPRLAEGIAPWRNQQEAREAGRRWLEVSLDDAAAGTGAVFVAIDAGAAAVTDAAHAHAHADAAVDATVTPGALGAGAAAGDGDADQAPSAADASAEQGADIAEPAAEAATANTGRTVTPAAAEDGAASQAPSACVASVVGVLSIRPSWHFTGERDGYIGELAVAKHAGRRGIGRSLVAAADAWARDQGLAHLTLHTGIYNTSARAFYAALGFAEEEVRLTRPVPPAGAGPLPQDHGN
jgi:ribosomal protein S18 acetylase RimI-like enzyme